ncbi:MAG: LysM peptidoglycan-binding domain-containing protein, partial [Planctomycetes bacterium]|nr:LysM peptidoglycan-binding domain-containing protein [Planctomycetota bacterium]
MSTEAKISLAVGLAFIICFAIVLTNRGRPLGPAVADRAPGDATEQRRNASNPIRLQDRVRDRVSPKGSAHPSATSENTWESGSKRADSTRSPRRIPIKHKQLAQRAETPPGSAFTRADVQPAPQPIQPARGLGEPTSANRKNGSPVVMEPPASRVGPPPSDRGPNKTADDRPPISRVNDSEPYKILAINDPAPDSAETPPSGRPSTRTQRDAAKKAANQPTTPLERSERRHTVVKGESLWSIVHKYYGRANGRLLNAVFEANRETLESPDRLKVGVALILPEVNGHAPVAGRSKTVGDGPRGRSTKPTGGRSNDHDGKIIRPNGRRLRSEIGE